MKYFPTSFLHYQQGNKSLKPPNQNIKKKAFQRQRRLSDVEKPVLFFDLAVKKIIKSFSTSEKARISSRVNKFFY